MSSTVKDVMSAHVTAVRPGAGYKEMAAMLRDRRVSAFPVIDEDGKVIGVVSESDLLVKEALEGTVPGVLRGLTQRHVRSQVTGLVTIAGSPETAETGREIIAAARHVEGVLAVRDRLSYPLTITAHSDPPPD